MNTQAKPKALKALKSPAANEAPMAPVAVVAAIKALHVGEASAHQQRIAIEWIIKEGCYTAHLAYQTNDRDTTFALGRQFVGGLLAGFINADLSSLRRAENHVETQTPSAQT